MTDFPPPPPPGPPPASAPPVADRAASQVPWWKRRWWKLPVWAWLTILALFIAAGAAGGGGKKDNDASATDTSSALVTDTPQTDVQTTNEVTTESATTEAATTVPETTDAPTTTAEPTTTSSTSSTTTTTLAPVPVVFTGSGDDVVDIGANNDRPFLIAGHDGSRNFIVAALDENLQRLDGVVNEIGPFLGTVSLLGGGAASDVRYLEVQADGNWSLELIGLDRLPIVNDPSFAGTGQQIVFYQGGGGVFTVTHDGSENFIVRVTTAEGSDGIVNEIGQYSGRKAISAGPAIIEINADGNWTFTHG